MSIEYRGGTFSKNMPIMEAFKYFEKEMVRCPDQLKALHVGTEEELDELKESQTWKPEEKEQKLQEQIDELKLAVEDLKPVKSRYIHIPTDQERKALQDIIDSEKKAGFMFPV